MEGWLSSGSSLGVLLTEWVVLVDDAVVVKVASLMLSGSGGLGAFPAFLLRRRARTSGGPTVPMSLT
jgi:hypothetical protein